MSAATEVVNTINSIPSASSSTTQCTVIPATAPNSKCMKFGQLKEELDKWVLGLLDSERDFAEKVQQLKATDGLVFQNISRLECLHQSLDRLTKSQVDVNSDLNRIGGELLLVEDAVRNLENLADAKTSSQANRAAASCFDGSPRNNLYNFMIQLNSDLNRSTKRLADVIEASNHPRQVWAGTGPVPQIGCVLNYHYECLVDIEEAYLKSKTALENIKKIQEQMKPTC